MQNLIEETSLDPDSLPDYIRIGRKVFPGEGWDEASGRLTAMLSKWPDGYHLIRRSGEIVAYMSLWPIRKSAAKAIENGSLLDSQINAQHLRKDKRARIENWLLMVIASVEPRASERAESLGLLMKWADKVLKDHAPCRVLAHAATLEGRQFLLKNGFEFAVNPPSDVVVVRDYRTDTPLYNSN